MMGKTGTHTIREIMGSNNVEQKPEHFEELPKDLYTKIASFEIKELIKQLDDLKNIWIEHFADKYIELKK